MARKAGEAVLRGAHAYCPGVLAATRGLCEGDEVAVSIAMELPGAHQASQFARFVRKSIHHVRLPQSWQM